MICPCVDCKENTRPSLNDEGDEGFALMEQVHLSMSRPAIAGRASPMSISMLADFLPHSRPSDILPPPM